MRKKLFTILQYLVFLGIGFFLAWLSLKNLDTQKRLEIKVAVEHARYWLVVPVFLILIMAHFVRAVRWKLLINSLGYQIKTQNTFFAVMSGYLINLALPRFGEILKCTLLARYEKVPAEKLIGTIILERVIDALTLIVILFITFVIQPSIYTDLINAFFHSPHEPHKRKIAGWIIALIVIGIFSVIVFLWMVIKKKNFADLVAIFKRIGRSIWQGISAVEHLKRRWTFLFYSVLLWFLYFIAGYIGLFALQETSQQVGVDQGFAVLSAGSIGMTIMPGGIGAYPLLIGKTMEIYGLSESISIAFGWILWVVQTGIILLVGIISLVLLPNLNKKKIPAPETA
jgi:glycosyltransferase 2 family protein